MFLYNVTMNVDMTVEQEWLKWMKETHLKGVMSTGCFEKCDIFRLLSEESQGVTYAVQYFSKSMDQIETYQRLYGAKMEAGLVGKYGNKVLSFRTLLEKIT